MALSDKARSSLYAAVGAIGYAVSSSIADKAAAGRESRFEASPTAAAGSVLSLVFAARGLTSMFSPAFGPLMLLYGVAAWEAWLKARAHHGPLFRAGWGREWGDRGRWGGWDRGHGDWWRRHQFEQEQPWSPWSQ